MEIPVADDTSKASFNRDKHVAARQELLSEHGISIRFHANAAPNHRKAWF
jgi:hypothetical protein